MFSQPEAKPDFSKIDEAITAWWKENRIFEKSIELREAGQDYIFYDGPPFMSGMPHYATLLSSLPKDAIPRYQTMKGRRVERLWGWDCHGLPIENKVEKELGLSGRKDILNHGLKNFIEKCYDWNRVGIENWRWYIDKIGRWADMDNAYRTMDQDYMESVWWVFKQMWDKGLIYKGKRTSLFSTDSSTPVSNFEVSMDPDNYRDTEDVAVTVKFRLSESSQKQLGNKLEITKPISLLAWTTTPWTLPSNFALAVNPKAKYVAIEIGNEVFILVSTLVKTIAGDREHKVIAELKATDLSGLDYVQLLDFLKGGPNDFKVYTSEYVTTDEGTGILHVAPAFGEADSEMGKQWELSFTSDIDEAGIMQVGPWKGTYIRNANQQIADFLEAEGNLFKQEKYLHRLPYYRYENPLIYKVQESYFVNVQKLKAQLVESNKDINWVPAHFKEGRFEYNLETAPDWSISRSRFWGTSMPIWESEDGEQTVIGSRDELMACVNSGSENKIKKVILKLGKDSVDFNDVLAGNGTLYTYTSDQANLSEVRHKYLGETVQESSVKPLKEGEERAYYLINNKPLDLHRPYIDEITFEINGKKFKRVEETLDVWMDSGSMPFAQFHYPFTNGKKFKENFPGDFIAEYTGQIRAWFYVLHLIANAVFDSHAFKNVLVTGVLAGTDGRKMSKSFGNYPDPKETLEKYGGDALRLYFLGSPLMLGNDANFNEVDLAMQIREFLLPMWNNYTYFVTYAKVHDWVPRNTQQPTPVNILDQWMLARLHSSGQTITQAFDTYDLPLAVRTLRGLINDTSKWYIRRSRNRFVEGDQKGLNTLYFVLIETIKYAAPLIPFTTETIYQNLVLSVLPTEPKSIHLTVYPLFDERFVKKTEELVEQMKSVRVICDLGQSIRVTSGIKVRQPLARLEVPEKLGEVTEWMLNLIKDELNVKEVVSTKAENVTLDTHITPELEEEGIVREVIRAIQALRKQEGLQLGEEVAILYSTADKKLSRVIAKNAEAIAKAVSATTLHEGKGKQEAKVNEATLLLTIQK